MPDFPLTVTLEDGTTFQCGPRRVGSRDLRAWRWRIVDAAGVAYIGPLCEANGLSATALRELVGEWWALKLALGQEGVNAARRRVRLRSLA